MTERQLCAPLFVFVLYAMQSREDRRSGAIKLQFHRQLRQKLSVGFVGALLDFLRAIVKQGEPSAKSTLTSPLVIEIYERALAASQ